MREIGPPAGTEPLHWRLLTTHAVDTPQAALEIVQWYRRRWNIEQLFWTLKRQGLDIEASQVERAAALVKLAFLATVAATRIMQLVRARNAHPAGPGRGGLLGRRDRGPQPSSAEPRRQNREAEKPSSRRLPGLGQLDHRPPRRLERIRLGKPPRTDHNAPRPHQTRGSRQARAIIRNLHR